MNETRVLKTIACLGTVGFIVGVWLDGDETPATAFAKTAFAVVMFLIVTWCATAWQITSKELDAQRAREREMTESLLSESKALRDQMSRVGHSTGANA